MFPYRLVALLVASSLFACGSSAASVSEVSDQGAADELAVARVGKFERFVGRDGRHYFHLLAGNGEKVLASQGYSTASNAQRGIEAVQLHGKNLERLRLREASDGQAYFVVTSTNGAIIAVSEMYTSTSNAKRGLETVARVVESTLASGDAPAVEPSFETFRGLDGRSYFHLKANNGEIVLRSQAYTSRSSAVDGTRSVIANGSNRARYELKEAADGHFYFVLKAANGETIGVGETYDSKWNAERGISTVMELLTAGR